MRSRAFRLLMAQALAVCLVVLPACGGGGSGAPVATPEPPTPTPTPTPIPTPTPAGLAPTRVNTTVAGSQSGAQVFATSDGGFVVAWSGAAQRYAADGSPVGAEQRQGVPVVAGASYVDLGMRPSLPNGGWERWFMAYQDIPARYLVQRYGADLTPQGGPFVPPLPTPPLEPSGAQLQGGGVVQIVYENLNPGVTAPRRVIRRADASGRVYQTGIEFSAEPTYRLIALADGGYAVLLSSANGGGLTVRRFSAQDVESGPPLKIAATDPGATEVSGQLVADPRGGFAVLWWDRPRNSGMTPYRLRRFDSSGEPREPTRELVGLDATQVYGLAGSGENVILRVRTDGSLWMLWPRLTTVNGPRQLVGRSFGAGGSWDGPARILTSGEWGITGWGAAILRDGSSITAWSGEGLDGDGAGIGMLRHDAQGAGMALPAPAALPNPLDQPLLGFVRLNGEYPLSDAWRLSRVVATGSHYLALWNQADLPQARGRWFTRAGLPAGEAFSVFGNDPRPLDAVGAWANADGSVTVLGGDRYSAGRAQVLRRVSVTGPLSDNLSSAVSNSVLTDVSASAFADGGALLSWNTRQGSGTQVQMAHMVQLLDSAGKPRGTEAELRRGPLSGSAAVLRDGSWLALWAEPGGNVPGVYWRRYGVDGKPLGEARRANTTPAWCSGRSDYVVPWVPSAAVIDGGFVVAWVAEACGEPLSQSIRVQRFDAAGAPVGGEFMLSGGSPGARELTQLDATPGGGFRALWMANRQGVYFPFTETQTQAFTAQLASASPLTVLPGVSWHSLASFGPLDFVMMADRDALPDVPYSSQHAFIRQFSLTWP